MDQEYGGDFFARVSRFVTNVDPAIVVFGIIFVMILVGLGLFGKRTWLFQVLMLSLIFSASVFPTLDAGSSLLRWLVLGILAATWMVTLSLPGPAWICYVLYNVIGFAFALISTDVERSFSLQSCGLSLIVVFAAASFSGVVKTRAGLSTMCKMCAVAGFAWMISAVGSLPRLLSGEVTAQRVSGSSVSAPLYVVTGGLLLLFVLWNAMTSKSRFMRWSCIGMAVVIVSCLVVSGQRTGLFGAIIGSVVFLWQGGMRRLGIAAAVCLVAGLAVVVVLKFNPRQADFLMRRYFSTDTSGRQFVWSEGIQKCMERPLYGRGLNVSDTIQIPVITGAVVSYINSYHNCYLMAWYDTGLVGLLFFMAPVVICFYKLVRILMSRPDRELKFFARLFLAVLITLALEGMTERGFHSPSAISTIIYVFLLVQVQGLEYLVRASKVRSTQMMPSLAGNRLPWMRPGYMGGT